MSVATDMLAAYHAAELAVLKGQTFRLGERQLTRANLVEIQTGRAQWQRAVDAEVASTSRRSGYAVADFSGCSDRRWERD